MSRLVVYLKPKFEEYDVKVYVYNDVGKLIEERSYLGIKQVVIRASEIRVSRQLFHDYLALVVETQVPNIEVKENSLLYISG